MVLSKIPRIRYNQDIFDNLTRVTFPVLTALSL